MNTWLLFLRMLIILMGYQWRLFQMLDFNLMLGKVSLALWELVTGDLNRVVRCVTR